MHGDSEGNTRSRIAGTHHRHAITYTKRGGRSTKGLSLSVLEGVRWGPSAPSCFWLATRWPSRVSLARTDAPDGA